MKLNDFTVGVLPKGLDDLIQALAFPQKSVFYFTERNSPEYEWIRDFLPIKQILTYEFLTKIRDFDQYDFSDVVRYSNLTQVLQIQKINYVIFSQTIDRFLENWSKTNEIQIISSPYLFRKKFENKIWFDKFLAKNNFPKPQSYIYNHSKNPKNISKKMVLQKANSCGGEGTFFIKNKDDVEKLLVEKKIKKNENYLLREYIEGKTYGISVFVSPKVIACSAIRQQYFYPKIKFNQKIFAGIQWVAAKNISPKLHGQISKIFTKFGEIFYQEKYLGYTNFDFIVDKNDDIFLIECNPRFSEANYQVLCNHELISGIPTENIFIQDFLQQTSFSAFTIYPFQNNNNYEGATIQIKVLPKTLIHNDFRSGLYAYRNGRIDYLHADIRKLAFKGSEFAFKSNTSIGSFYKKQTEVASVISNFPLFNNRTGEFNQIGEQITKKFAY